MAFARQPPQPLPHRALRPAVAALLASGLAACAGASRPGLPGVPGDECVVVPTAPDAAATARGSTRDSPSDHAFADRRRPVVVGLPGPVDPAHAPLPRTESERLVFAQLYRPVVRLACGGRAAPALADSWRAERDGRRWTFTLRADARDWAGEPVTAVDVAESWLAAWDVVTGGSADGGEAPRDRRGRAADRALREPRRLGRPGFTAVDVVDRRTVRVELSEPVTIGFFARPELAVRTSRPSGPSAAAARRAAVETRSPGAGRRPVWPSGSGPYRPGRAADPRGPLTLTSRLDGPDVEFRTVADDARNALDTGVDLLVTAEPAVIDYAAASDAFLTVPLAWDRTYLVLTDRADAETGGTARGWRLARPPEAALAALARDAVRVRARAAGLGLDDPDACAGAGAVGTGPATADPGMATAGADTADPTATSRVAGIDSDRARPASAAIIERRSGRRETRIVYPADDPVARALAERLVALALDPGRPDARWLADAAPALLWAGGRARAVELAAPAFAAAVRTGGEAAYVLPVERAAGSGACDIVGALLARAPWLAPDGPTPRAGAAAIVPLIETRRTLIVRGGIAGVAVDGHGTLLLDRLRRTGAAADRAGTGPFRTPPTAPASAPGEEP